MTVGYKEMKVTKSAAVAISEKRKKLKTKIKLHSEHTHTILDFRVNDKYTGFTMSVCSFLCQCFH